MVYTFLDIYSVPLLLYSLYSENIYKTIQNIMSCFHWSWNVFYVNRAVCDGKMHPSKYNLPTLNICINCRLLCFELDLIAPTRFSAKFLLSPHHIIYNWLQILGLYGLRTCKPISVRSTYYSYNFMQNSKVMNKHFLNVSDWLVDLQSTDVNFNIDFSAAMDWSIYGKIVLPAKEYYCKPHPCCMTLNIKLSRS